MSEDRTRSLGHLFITPTLHFNPNPPCQPDFSPTLCSTLLHTAPCTCPTPRLPKLNLPPVQHHEAPEKLHPRLPSKQFFQVTSSELHGYFFFIEAFNHFALLLHHRYTLTLQLACQLCLFLTPPSTYSTSKGSSAHEQLNKYFQHVKILCNCIFQTVG